MEKLKELSSEITQALDMVLPENVRCVFVIVDIDTEAICTTSDMSDENAEWLLQRAIDTLRNPEESFDIQNKQIDNKQTN